jgi:hypothetical protein
MTEDAIKTRARVNGARIGLPSLVPTRDGGLKGWVTSG